MNIVRKYITHFTSFNKLNSTECIKFEKDFSCNNYSPLPVVIEKASGMYVTDC